MCDEIHAAGLGTKKHGMPCMTVARLAEAFGNRVQRPMKSWLAPCSTRDQNSRNRAMRVSGDQGGVDRPNGGADHPVGLDTGLMHRFIYADLIGAERSASLQHQHYL